MAVIIKIVELLLKEGQDLRFTIGLYAWNRSFGENAQAPSKVGLRWWHRAGLRRLGRIPVCYEHESFPGGSSDYAKTLGEELVDNGDARALDEFCAHWSVDKWAKLRMVRHTKNLAVLRVLEKHYGRTAKLDPSDLPDRVLERIRKLYIRDDDHEDLYTYAKILCKWISRSGYFPNYVNFRTQWGQQSKRFVGDPYNYQRWREVLRELFYPNVPAQ